jgi:molybdopterin-guanine dinucleotide biosynthesis protein A
MGRDKALLPWGDGDLLGHALARLARVTTDVRILSGPAVRYADRGRPVVTDAAPDQGPLAGTLAALAAAEGRPALLLAVDVPLVPAELLSGLVALLPGFDAVVPVTARGAEPLCAVYGPGCLEPVARGLATGERRMTAFWAAVRVREVSQGELAAFGATERLFANINEPGDYERTRG